MDNATSTHMGLIGFNGCTALETNSIGTVLCGTDDTLGGGGSPGAWESTFGGTTLTPTSTLGTFVTASSTFNSTLRINNTLTLNQGATTNSGLVINAIGSATANLFETRNSSGTFLSGFTASGGLLMNTASDTAFVIQNGSGTNQFVIDTNFTTIGTTTAATSLVIDTDTFVVNSNENEIGIGTATPFGSLDIRGATASTTALVIGGDVDIYRSGTNALTIDGTITVTSCTGCGGGSDNSGLESVQVFTTANDGVDAFNAAAGVTHVMVEVVGAGGGGGGGSGTDAGAGGGGGGYGAEIVESLSANMAAVVGDGGTGSDTNGTAVTGGQSYFGDTELCDALGGGGGEGDAVSGIDPGAGGLGGDTGACDIEINGNPGGKGNTGPLIAQTPGGCSTMGCPPAISNIAQTMVNSTAPGAGGNGEYSNAANGGTGGPGLVIVWEHSGTGAQADLAEWYETDGTPFAGDIVAMGDQTFTYDGTTGTHTVGVLRQAVAGDKIFGVVSTKPAIHMGKDILEEAQNPRSVGLSGRVPVHVSTANGDIKKGDLLTASSIPGVAVRTDKAGAIIGSSLEDYSAAPDQIGTILVFVQTTYSTGARTKTILEKVGINLDEIPETIDVGRLILAQLLLQKKQIQKTTELSEIITDRVVAGLEIISPRVITDTLVARFIEPVENEVTLELMDGGRFMINRVGQEGMSLSFDNASSTPSTTASTVISFDASGNAFFAGEVTASKVSANQIVGLEFIQNNLANLSGQVSGIATTTTQNIFASLASSTIDVLGINVAKDLAIKGALSVSDIAKFEEKVIFIKDVSLGGYLYIENASSTQVVFFDRDGNADFAGQVKAAKITAQEFEGPIFDSLNTALGSLASTTSLLATSTADLAGRVSVLESKPALDPTTLNFQNGISVGGLAALNGGLSVDTISSSANLTSFITDTMFIGRPYFTTDTAGFARIKDGDREVRVTFDREYIEQPIVNATISLDEDPQLLTTQDPTEFTALQNSRQSVIDKIFNGDLRYIIVDKSTKGFTIILNKPATADIDFSWTAFAVNGAKTFTAQPQPLVAPLPAAIITPPQTATSTPTLTGTTTPILLPISLTPTSTASTTQAMIPQPTTSTSTASSTP